MIYLVCKSENAYGLISFKNSWGQTLRNEVKLLPYEIFVGEKKWCGGTYIFADFDLLTEKQSDLASKIYNLMASNPEHFRMLNNPHKSLNRYNLLKKLQADGINDFAIFLTSEISDCKFPVFVRKEADHSGKISELLHHQSELETAILEIRNEGYAENGILISEFCNTADSYGIYRKYSAFVVGENVVPRHIFFSRHWMIRSADLTDRNFVDEELDYVRNNPHEEKLRDIFKLANIQYGRIDYSLKNDRVAVWEINPNPMIASSSSLKKTRRQLVHLLFSKKMVAAFQSENLQVNNNFSIENPYLRDLSLTDIRQIFPFKPTKYLLNNTYYHLKSVLLFNFYQIRNKLRNNQ